MSGNGINWLGVIVGIVLLLVGIGLTIWGSGYTSGTIFNPYTFFFGIALGGVGIFVLAKSH